MCVWKCMLCTLHGPLDVLRDHAVSSHKRYFSRVSIQGHGCVGCFQLFVYEADFVNHFVSCHVVAVLPRVCRCGSRFGTQHELERHIHDECSSSVIKYGKPGYY